MSLPRALVGLALLAALYVGALGWVDARGGVFASAAQLWPAAPVVLAATLLSFVLRYLRWHWLLRRAGSACPLVAGFVAYIAGFAFTATPGKVGELVRIRYFARLGVPGDVVVAAFVFEHATDLLTVLALASLFVGRPDLLAVAALFVLALLAAVVVLARTPSLLARLAAWLQRWKLRRCASAVSLVGAGLAGSRRWLTPTDLLVSFAFSFASWGVLSVGFLELLRQVTDVVVPTLHAVAMYPLAMLAGSASMLPAGVGSMEATLVALLVAAGVPLAVAALTAIGIRLGTLWVGIACGIACVALLEYGLRTPGRASAPDSRLRFPDDRPRTP